MKKLMLILFALSALLSQERIIAIGHSYADIVRELGKADELVGVSKAGKSISDLSHIESVGSARNLSLESLVALNPSIVIVSDVSGPKHVIENLKKMPGVKVLDFQSATDLNMLYNQINKISIALNIESKGDALIDELKRDHKEIQTMVKNVDSRTKALFIYARGSSLVFVAGKKTQADFVMGESGLENVINQFDGFKPLTTESIIQSDPEYIVMLRSGLHSLGSKENIFNMAGLKMSTAAKEKNMLLVDDQVFLSIGPCTIKEMKRIYREIYSTSG